jgi:hypothetical protein
MGIAAGRGGRKSARDAARRIEECYRECIHLTIDRRNTLLCRIDELKWCYLALAQQRHRLGCGETNELVTRSHDGRSGQRIAEEPLKSFVLIQHQMRTRGELHGHKLTPSFS